MQVLFSEVSDIIAINQMKATTLVILAAGMGSRFGGLKQLEPVTPEGETILDFSVYDAIRSGFRKIVFVVRREILRDFKSFFDHKLEGIVEVRYVCQDDFKSSEKRKKPFGTGHAVLAARKQVDENFCVINADDFYGGRSFESIANWDAAPDSAKFAMIGFKLQKTLSDHGTVSRGQCEIDSADFLNAVVERTGILSENGIISCDNEGKERLSLARDTVVSMNFWGFTTVIFEFLDRDFCAFLERAGGESEDEFFVNDVVNRAVLENRASVRVIESDESWMGITYKEDKHGVAERLAGLRADGVYPEKIW